MALIEKRLTDDEIKRLIAMGALKEHKGNLIINEPIGQYCPGCKSPIYYGENSDYTYCHCKKCRVNWVNVEMCSDDAMIYYVIVGALNGKYIFKRGD